MAQNNDVEKLYNALKRDGYDDLGTLDEFTSRVSDREKAGMLYNSMQREGYDDLGTEDEFYNRLNPAPEPGYRPTASELSDFGGTIASARRQAGGVTAGINTLDRYFEGRKKGFGQLRKPGVNGKVVEGSQHLNMNTGKLESTYITAQGNEYSSRELAEVEQNAVDVANHRMTLPGQLEDAYAERDRLQAEIDAETQRIGYGQSPERSFAPQVPGSIPRQSAERLSNDRLQTLYAAQRQNEERITALEAERDDDGGTQFWRGFLDAAKNPSTWTFGVTDLQNMTQLMRIKGKVDNGEELTDDEQSLLKNTMANGYTQQMFGENRGFMYRAGGIAMQALPFVAEFMATGGFNSLTQMGANAGTKVAERFALDGLKKSILRNTGVLMGDITAGFVMANTTGAARTGADIMERNIGQVTMDEEGNYQFEGGKSLGRSIYEGEVASTLEYYTEKLGEHLQLGNWIAKGADKMGLSKLSKAVGYLSNSKMLNAGGIQDYPSEVVEEQANLLLNAMLVGDNNFSIDPNSKDFDKSVFNPKTQLDIWGGMLFSIGLMQAPRLAHTGYNAAGYYAYKHATNTADVNAAAVFGDDNWQMIKEQIDNCDNEGMSGLLASVVEGDMSDEQKQVTMNYAANLLKMRGFNNGLMADLRGGDDFESSEEAFISHGIDQGYQQGREAQEPDEMKMYVDEEAAAREHLAQYGQEFANMVASQEPVETLTYLMNNRDYFDDEQIAAAADFYQKHARAQGVMDAAVDNVDIQVERANAEVRSNTHQGTGSVVMAKGPNDVDYYIIGGEIVTDEQGTPSLVGTGGAVVVKDPVTGEVSVKSPQELMMYSMQNADELIQQNETTLRQQLMQQADDDITFGSPASEVFDIEDTVTLQDGNGGVIEGQIVTLPNAIDGVFVVQTNDGRALQMTADDMNRRIVAHNGMQVQRATQPQEAPAAVIEQEQQPIGTMNTTGQEQPQQSGAEHATGESSSNNPASAGTQPQSALSRIPVRTDANGKQVKNRKGQPILDWHKASVEDAAAALIETTGGDMVMARDTASDLVENAKAGLVRIRKQKPKGDDPIEIAESRMEIRRQEEEQQAIIKQWKDVNQRIQQQMREESEARQAAAEAAKSEEQRQREAEEARIRKEKQEAVEAERRRKQAEEEIAQWNKPYGPLAKARKEMQNDPDAAAILGDVEPRTLEEWVSSLLQPQSMMWDDETDPTTGRTVIGLQSELGLQKKDIERIGGLVASRSKGGKPFGQVVHDIWEQLPEGVKNMYDDQDVRNALIGLFGEGNTMRMRHLTEEHRIEEARQTMEENERRAREAETEAWEDFYHLTAEEREAYEDYLQQPPTAVEQEVIDQIIAENEQNQSSPAVDRQPDSGRTTGTVEGGEGQVQAEGEAEGNGNPAAPVAEAAEDGGNQPSVSGDEVAGGAFDRQSLAVLFEQIGASPVLAERMSDYEVGEMTAMVDEWEAYNDDYGTVIEQQKSALKSKDKKVRDAAQARIDEAQTKDNEAFVPIEEYIEGLNAKYGIESEEPFEGAIPTPEIDTPRYNAIRDALIDAYRSGDAAAITAAAQAVQQYVDEGLNSPDDHTEIFDIAEEYDGNDPEKLADQYIIRTFWDRYLDDDADKEYIKTGLKPGMRESKQQKPTPIHSWTTKKGRNVELFVMPEEIDADGNRHVKIGRSVDGGEIRISSTNGIDVPSSIIDYDTTYGDAEDAINNDVENGTRYIATEIIYLPDGRILAKGTIAGDKATFWLKEDPLVAPSEQLKPTELQDAVRPKSAELGVNEANARARGDSMIGRSLTEDEADDLIRKMQNDAEIVQEIELTPENWLSLFGEDGTVVSPLGDVTMGENQYFKLAQQGRNGKLGMVKPTIEAPDIVIEDEREAKSGKQERSTSYVFIKTFTKPDGTRYYYFASVTVRKEGHEVVISNQEKSVNRISRLLRQGNIAWINPKFSSHPYTQVGESVPLSDSNRPTSTDNQPAWLGINSPELSDGKGTNNSSNDQENQGNSAPIGTTSSPEQIAEEEGKVDSNPTDGQKEAGNYQKGHIKVDGYDITIENPKGSVRSGVDAGGNRWETEMHNTYGYIRGTEGVDGDHIDVFLSDNPTSGNVYVVDQVNPSTGEFDEHKVMYGFASEEEARQAYLSNYSEGWQGLGAITEVSREDFKKWINSSHRKTKPFAEYKSVKKEKPASGTPKRAHKRIVSDDQMEELRKKLLEKFNNMNAGIDVERMLLGAMYAVGKIERGVTKFADYAQEMVNEIGDAIRPYLKSFYNAVRDMPEAAAYRDQMDSAEYVEAFDVDNFDKGGKVPDALTKAKQVVRRERAKKEVKKVQAQQPDLFADMFAGMETEQNVRQVEQQQQRPSEPREKKFRKATEADFDGNGHLTVWHKGKPHGVVAVVRSGEQISADQFSKPHISSVVMANGDSAPLSELEVEDTSAGTQAKPKTAWWDDPKRPASLDPSDYHTYTTDEAKAYFEQFKSEDGKVDFTKWTHPNLAYITAAAWDGAVIPVEELMQIAEIREAENRVKEKDELPLFKISNQERRALTARLLDAEHGSAVFENGKIKKVNGKEVLTGPVRQEKKAFVVVGRPACGKSSVFANRLSHDNGARIVDSDVVKPWLSGYDEGYGAGYVQPVSAGIANSALAKASDAGDNIVLPRIGGSSVMKEVMMLREKGYDVQIFYNEVSEQTSIMRAASRFAQEGRYLSLDYLTHIEDKDSKSFRTFVGKKIGDYYAKNQQTRRFDEGSAASSSLLVGRSVLNSGLEQNGRGTGANVSGLVSDGRSTELPEGRRPEEAAGTFEDELIFSYAEWKSNDVAFGEKPKEIWNSKSGKPMPGQKEEKKNEVQSEQGLSGEPSSSGEGERKEGRGTGPVRERLGTEQDRPERVGSERTVSQEPAKPKQEPQKNKRNNQGKRGEDYAPTSPKARFNANVEAIRLMRDLTDQGIEVPTKEQMAVLRQYSGWGGLGTYFNDENSAENRLLRDMLSEEEYNDAALSINSAYFTPAFVIDSMWDIAKAMGFKGGNILEGSAGIGNIIGQMPSDIGRRSDIEAVEIDKISGNILKLLYPDAKVHIQGFQDTMIRNGSVDLAITNVPFVTGLHVFDKVDKDLSRRFTNIHDFCIAKNIRKLREGGIGIFITSRGTLDNSNDLRAWITDEGQADVVGAFRLNNETFGGTTVTSDIIVVRKRFAGKTSEHSIDVSKASPLKVGSYEDKYGDEHQVTMVVNDYFKEHPEMMAGEMAFGYEKGDTYRPGSYGLYPVEGKDQQKMLASFAKSMSKIREDASREAAGPAAAVETNQLTAEKEGRMLIDDKGRLCVSQYGEAVPLNLNAQKVKGQTKEQCFKDYQAVQKAVDDVLQQQLSDPNDAALKPKLDALNKAYDTFVKRYGYLHKNTAISFLRNDIDFPSFLALEDYKEIEDIHGKKTVKAEKTKLFTERVLGFKTEPQPKTVKDAVVASMFRSNGIDLEWITSKLNEVAAPTNGDKWTTDDVRKGILVSRLGFEDPSTGQLEIRYKYLSGNVREKLAIAEAYNTDGKYAANVEELRKVVPMDIPAHLIDFSLGSSWIPMELYKEYLQEMYDLTNVKLSHIEGMWVLDPQYRFHNEKNRTAGVYSEQFRETIYGHQLVAAALNNRPVKVAKQVSEGYGSNKTTKTVVDQAATQACAVRMDEIKDEFKQWAKKKMQEDAELAERIEKIYNDKFNALVPMQIDDEFLPDHFEGANMNITLRPHQKRGALRGLTSPTMLAHEVGTGKSFTLLTTAMEMRRLGTAKKPMIVVQNATVAQMTADAKLLYPNAKVLSLSEKDRTAEGRRSFYAKIKYNDWDIIIIPQSTLNMIPDSPERELQFIQEKIDEKKHVIEAAEAAGVEGRELDRLKRELEKIEQEYGDTFLDSGDNSTNNSKKGKKKDAKREAASLDKAKTSAQKMLDRQTDDVQYFDDLGVDAILVDEAHEYKHLGFQTSIGRGIKGIDPSYSKKCAGLYNKTRSVFDKAGWKNVVFATGTPISNTAAEIWTFMKYLMPADVMKANDIYYFDDFVHNFGNISQSLEFQTNGKFKEVTRFAAYFNKPELIRIWTQVADIVRTEDTTVQDKIPAKENGKDQDVFLPQSPSLINIMAAVRAELERFEKMDGKQKKENSHIPLTMYGIAKRAAIDPRLVNPDAPDEPLSKTNAAVKEIVKDLKATQDYKGTVAVFCDNQNRKGADGNIEFNIFDDMKAKLIAQGVPESQIAIIKSGLSITAKQKIFDAVNTGEIRVVLGSTQTLGTGVNMQERLHLLIHMDAPDRPMDYTQRNGRIERQGNLHKVWGKTIRILRFGVEDSLDVTAYQRLKTKSGFIDSIMDGKESLVNNQVDRTVEEEEEGLFDNPVAVLSGSQYALKKNQAERELRKYQGKKSQWEADQVYVANALRWNKSVVDDAERQISEEQKQLAHIKGMFPDGKVKTITIQGVKVDAGNTEKLAKVMKEKVNDPVNAIVKRNRENAFYNDEVVPVKIELDGHAIDFEVSVERESVYDNGRMRTVIHKYVTYKSADLREERLTKSSGSVKDMLDEILDEIVTGRDYQDRIDALNQKIDRLNAETEQLQQRVGIEFQFEKQLEQAKKQVEEYTELMRKEMEEKEKKYAAQQTEAVDLSNAESEDDEDGTLYSADEDILSDHIIRVLDALENEHPGFNDAFSVDPGLETGLAEIWVSNREAAMQLYKNEHPDAQGDYYFSAYMWARNLFEDKLRDPSLQTTEDALPDFAVDAEQQRSRIIGTDNFKGFFGDWQNEPEHASKVVDADGKPLILYHATNLTKVNKGKAFWTFYPDSHFGTVGQSNSVVRDDDGIIKTYPVYLNIRNPKRVSDVPDGWLETHSEWWEKQIKRAKEEGYDGIVYLNRYEDKEHPADSWIAFYPEQVKSAQENVGTYDPTNPDIRYRYVERFREGQTFAIFRTDMQSSYNVLGRSSTYSTELMPDAYSSEQALLDAVRNQYPEYYVTIEDGSLRMESWRHVMAAYKNAETESQRTRKDAGRKSYVERKTRNAINAVQSLAKQMGLDVEILTTTDGLEGKKARAKGFFNPKTGKITLVLPNNVNQSDLIKTLLHEGVAHAGLRKMFGPHFATFLDNVYNNVSPEIKRRIDVAMKKNGWSRHTATEEYLARLAERTDFEYASSQGWWQKIKEFFVRMLAEVGVRLSEPLTDNELRYILWRSYDNLLHPDRRRSIFDTAKEITMQRKLGINRYARERERLQRTGRTDTSRIVAEADSRVNEGIMEADEMGLLMRDDDAWVDDVASEVYEKAVAKDSMKWQEAWQDSMISLKAIQDAIAQETGKVATGAENAYLFENRMHGRAKNMSEHYDWRFYRPMLKAFNDFCKQLHYSQEQGMDYLISKSGLERNIYYAFRDGAKAKMTDDIKQEREKLEKDYAKHRISEADYLTRKQELEEQEYTGVDDFMQKVREMYAYQHAKEEYDAGNISYSEYLRITEAVIRGQLKRSTPKKDADGNVVSDNYYDEYQQDYSGLTETFAKELYDDAQQVKKQAQRAIDPQERRALWSAYNEQMRNAYITARQEAEDAVFAAEDGESKATSNDLWDKINAATKETLRQSYESGLIDRNNYNKVLEMFNWYIPLRGWEEDKASDVYTYMGRDNVFSPAVKKTWGRKSKAENPLAYIGNIAISTILSGHRNQMKQHFLNYVMNNPTSLVSISESWYENIAPEGESPVWILRSADTAGKSGDEIAQIVSDFNDEMRQKQRDGKAMPVRGRLRLDVNATKGQKAEHVVEVQRAGHTYQLYINGNPKAAQALNGSAARAVSRISDTWLGEKITGINRSMAAFFTSKNPAFVVSNLSRDLNMAGASVAVNEGKEYNARFIANVAKVLSPRVGESSKWVPASKQPTGLMPSLMRKWKKGTLDETNETERLFKEFMDEGGETGFVNMLSIDSFKEKMQKELAEMNGSTMFGARAKVKETSIHKGLRLLGDTFEFYNRCAEDATRFIVYMTSRQMGKTLEESIADAKDVTLNFNRKGTGGLGNAEVRDLFIFVNPAIQALANMYRMAKGHPLKFGAVTAAFVAGGALMPILNQWLLNMFGDDDDKQAYWNLPPWVRKNNLVMWVPFTKNFITIPLAQEFRVFYGVGEMVSSAVMDHPVDKMGLEVFSSVADLVPINPTGNGGNLMVDFAPTMVQPLMQVGENIDFTGKPIWRENQGNKHAPMYTKAYVSTPTWMVKVSESLNDVTGGNEGRKGVAERYMPFWGEYINNPAVWNHLLQGYFGGMYNTIAKTFDVGVTAASGELPKIYQTPVINRFLNRPVERDNAGVLGEDYYNLTERRDALQYELRIWQKKAADGEEGAQEHVDEILSSDEWKRAEVVSHYEKIMRDLKAGERAATNKEDKEQIKESISLFKQQMMEELNALNAGMEPLDAAQEAYRNAKTYAEKNKLRMRIERLVMSQDGGKANTKGRSADVEKALSYISDEEKESRDTNEKYLALATAEDIRDDARIKAAKAKIRPYKDEYKRLADDGKQAEAAQYRQKYLKYFVAQQRIDQLSRAMNANKKLLGKGHDQSILRLIAGQRSQMLKAIEGIE